ncbi:hypothetical protein [Demequina salsinemoris]|uniref:hypothetical protein n=1 Tax=Demequina salsinemoris TaxID=577470 RepID=UPI00128D74C0|nr:hypothetical protein [Demequina salsinemoris]
MSAVLVMVGAPAFADNYAIDNDSAYWHGIESDGGFIWEAETQYPDLWGTGITVWSLNTDAFDNLPYQYTIASDLADVVLNDSDFSEVSATAVDGGVSTFVADAPFSLALSEVGGATVDFTLRVTLTIEGSYASWDFAVTSDSADPAVADAIDELTVSVEGDLGSDGQTVFVPVDATSMVSYEDDGIWSDPVVAYKAIADAVTFDAVDGDDEPTVTMELTSAGEATLILSLQGFDVCSKDDAIAAQVAAAPALDTTFGADNDLIASGGCWSAETAEGTAGEEFDQTIVLEPTADKIESFDGMAPEDVVFALLDAPAGLTVDATYDPIEDVYIVHITGVVADAGAYEVRLGILISTYGGEECGDECEYSYEYEGSPWYEPTVAVIPITVHAAVVPEAIEETEDPEPEPVEVELAAEEETVETAETAETAGAELATAELAETGAEETALSAVALALIASGAGAIALYRRRVA